MSKRGYRHCYYNGKEGLIYLRTWDNNGNRVVTKHIHKPYLFVKSSTPTEYQSIFGDYLKKMEFRTSSERNAFVDTTNVEIFYNFMVEQQFLLDYYRNENFENLLTDPLKVVSIDIECPSDKEFPNPEDANHPINVIGCHDSLSGKYHIFGIGPYNVYSVMDHCKDIDPLDIVYYNCVDERTLLNKFARWWRSDFPDVIVSWNGFSFDIPYIVNRINKIFGEDKAKSLSPYDQITFRDVKNEKYGNTYREYTFKGITHLDYMMLYKTLKPEKNLDSFTLDYVAKEELGDVGKVDLEGLSLYELSIKKFNKYVSYNIQDINLINMMDSKLRLIELTRFLCTMGFSNFDRVYGKVAFIAGMFARRSLDKGQYMLTKRPEKTHTTIPGGYVKEPAIGLRHDIVYFDANSLYPNTIISLNISPETKRGKVRKSGKDCFITYKGKDVHISTDELSSFLIENNLTMTGSGDLFTKDFMGVLPEFCDFLYKKRVEHKELMLRYEDESTKHNKGTPEYSAAKLAEGTQFIIQNVYKTVMNSCYGVLVNRYFPIYDPDCGMSITLSGQVIIQQTFKILNNYLSNVTGIQKDFVVCGDTDSVAVELKEFLELKKQNIYGEDGFLNESFKPIEDELSNVLNGEIRDWVVRTMNSGDVRYKFKRETVCKNALFIAKKNYVLNIVNKEGVNLKKLIVKGHLNKAVCSKKIKGFGMDLAKGILLQGWNETQALEFYQQIMMETLKTMTIPELAIRKNIKDFEKYSSKAVGLVCASKTPEQHKAGNAYNYMLHEKNVENKYRKITNGTKVQIVSVHKNPYNIDRIAYIDELPPEFGFELNLEDTANKSLIYYIKPLYGAMGWTIPTSHNLYAFNLNDLF